MTKRERERKGEGGRVGGDGVREKRERRIAREKGRGQRVLKREREGEKSR